MLHVLAVLFAAVARLFFADGMASW